MHVLKTISLNINLEIARQRDLERLALAVIESFAQILRT